MNNPLEINKQQSSQIVGLNFSVKGKLKTGQSFESLAKNWTSKAVTIDGLAAHICKGYAWMPGLLKPGARRKNENVDRAELLAVDVDHGMAIGEALLMPIIKEWGCLGITSSSHSEVEHKFRVVFRLPVAIVGADNIKSVNKLLIEAIGVADKACKDAARFFFGAENAQVFLKQDVRLPADWQEQCKVLIDSTKEVVEPMTRPVAVIPQLGSTNLIELLHHDIYPRLTPEQIYSWSGHEWASKNNDKMRGACPWHESQSGAAFYVDRKNGTWLWRCPSCDVGGSPVEYRHRLNGGKGSPQGKDFVAVVKELAADAGVAMPIPTFVNGGNAFGATEERRDTNSEIPTQEIAWHCLETLHHQIGFWRKPQFLEPHEEGNAQELVKSNPAARLVVLPDPETKLPKLALQAFAPKADFDFSVSKILTSSDGNGGLMLTVKRVESGKLVAIEAFVKSSATYQVKDFISVLKRETGRNLSCTLKQEELQALIQNRESYYRENGGRTYCLADVTGQQSDGNWVFEDCQFKVDGTPTTEEESLWVFNHQLGDEEKIPSPKIASQNPEALKDLVAGCVGFFSPEALPLMLFCLGHSVATTQRQSVMEQEGLFPQLALFGDPGGGKSTASEVAASITGMHRFSISSFTPSLLYENIKSLSGLTLVLNDPIKPGKNQVQQREQFDGILWSLYNGKSRKVRGNEQTPHTNVIVTSNVALGEGNQAVESRLIKLHFPVKPMNSKGYADLRKAMDGASGGLSQLLAIAYDSEAVKDIESRLKEFLSHAHSRIAGSLALVTYFTQRFCDVAGYEFDAFTYCKNHLCPSANEFESDKDSLTDFLEKLDILKSEGVVGEWNLTQVSKGSKPYLAVYLSAIWGEFEKRFSPNYSRQGLQRLAEGKGGQQATQKFVSTKMEWLDYQRAIAEYERRDFSNWEGELPPAPMRPKKLAARKCLLIPDRVVAEILGGSVDVLSTNFSDYKTELPPDVEPEVTQKLPDPAKLPVKLPKEVTCVTQTENEIQPKVTEVTQVTTELQPTLKKGGRVEVIETGQTGTITDIEDNWFATIKLDVPIQCDDDDGEPFESWFQGITLGQLRALKSQAHSFKVGDRVRHEGQFWKISKIRAGGILELDHATLLKATTAKPVDVEAVKHEVTV